MHSIYGTVGSELYFIYISYMHYVLCLDLILISGLMNHHQKAQKRSRRWREYSILPMNTSKSYEIIEDLVEKNVFTSSYFA